MWLIVLTYFVIAHLFIFNFVLIGYFYALKYKMTILKESLDHIFFHHTKLSSPIRSWPWCSPCWCTAKLCVLRSIWTDCGIADNGGAPFKMPNYGSTAKLTHGALVVTFYPDIGKWLGGAGSFQLLIKKLFFEVWQKGLGGWSEQVMPKPSWALLFFFANVINQCAKSCQYNFMFICFGQSLM